MNEPVLPGTPLHQIEVPVRWSDRDVLGHVNNVQYLRYFEMVRIDWYEKLTGSKLEPSNQEAMVIVNVQCDFLLPVHYPATLLVSLNGSVPGRSSIDTYYSIVDQDSHTLYAKGSSRLVWISTETQRSTPIPQHIRDRLPAVAS